MPALFIDKVLNLQSDLDSTVDVWNNHLIRPSRTQSSPYGRPNIMYQFPELWGSTDYLCKKDEDYFHVAKTHIRKRTAIPCDKDVYEWCLQYMNDNSLSLDSDADKAIDLYLTLKREIKRMLV
jgi:hypothetical protein